MNTPDSMISRAKAFLDARRGERVTLEELARTVGASRFHLQRRFKRAFGMSPSDYQREVQLKEAKKHLVNGHGVTDALYAAGYGSVSRFYEKTAARLGMAARQYRARGKGALIRYTTFDSPLGRVLIGMTERGLCSVMLGAHATDGNLAAEFSETAIVEDARGLTEYREAILNFLRGDVGLAKIPLDVRGTVFQRKVWQALRTIPRGETRSYQQIARTIGAPRAVRAVGSACGANPAALVIPCHRALRSDGSLGGYAWGIERKRRLLAIEKRTRR